MGKRKALHMGRTQRKEGAAHVYFKFNSQTFERLRAKFQEMCSSSRDEIFRNNDLSIEVASKGSLSAVLCSMKFELCEIKKGLKEQVTMHLYAATTSLMVEGKSGKILSKPPFRCFADVFLEPLIAQETSDLLEVKSEIERPPVKTQNCPICGKSVAEKEMNNHVDECLSVKAIATGSMLRNGKGHEMSSPVLVGKRKRSRVASSSSEDASISLLARPEVNTSKSTPMLMPKRKRVVLSSSDDDSPLKNQTHTGQGDCLRDISNHMENSSLMSIKKGATKKPRKNQFLDLEAELSGPEGSGDEVDEAEEGYEQSFVNDDTSPMCNKTSTAMYLRSVRSPEERLKRRLAPITDDLFSQPVRAEELVEDYEEDSFVVGSQEVAEETRMDDTLDMLERRAALPPPPPPRRKRIAVRPNEDTIHQTQMQPEAPINVVEEDNEESMSLLAGVVEETEFVRPTMRLLKPEVDKESGNQLSMVVNSGEVGRYSITFVLPIFLSSVLEKQSDQEWGGDLPAASQAQAGSVGHKM